MKAFACVLVLFGALSVSANPVAPLTEDYDSLKLLYDTSYGYYQLRVPVSLNLIAKPSLLWSLRGAVNAFPGTDLPCYLSCNLQKISVGCPPSV